MTATLIAYRGARPIGREELADLPTPAPTRTWTPIPHAELVRRLVDEFGRRGIGVVREQLAVQSAGGALLFGALDLSLTGPDGDYRAAFGFRTSNNKSLAIRAVAGYRVLVCSNLALTGDEQVLRRTHTGRLDIGREVAAAVDRFAERYGRVAEQVEAQKRRLVTDTEAKSLICDAFTRRLLPLRLLPAVHTEFFEPSYPEFATAPHSVWRLSNAFTHAAKELAPGPRHAGLNQLGRFFSNLLN